MSQSRQLRQSRRRLHRATSIQGPATEALVPKLSIRQLQQPATETQSSKHTARAVRSFLQLATPTISSTAAARATASTPSSPKRSTRSPKASGDVITSSPTTQLAEAKPNLHS